MAALGKMLINAAAATTKKRLPLIRYGAYGFQLDW
jgi:hypothetical protein